MLALQSQAYTRFGTPCGVGWKWSWDLSLSLTDHSRQPLLSKLFLSYVFQLRMYQMNIIIIAVVFQHSPGEQLPQQSTAFITQSRHFPLNIHDSLWNTSEHPGNEGWHSCLHATSCDKAFASVHKAVGYSVHQVTGRLTMPLTAQREEARTTNRRASKDNFSHQMCCAFCSWDSIGRQRHLRIPYLNNVECVSNVVIATSMLPEPPNSKCILSNVTYHSQLFSVISSFIGIGAFIFGYALAHFILDSTLRYSTFVVRHAHGEVSVATALKSRWMQLWIYRRVLIPFADLGQPNTSFYHGE